MNEIVIIIICVLSLIFLKIGLNIKIKEIIKFKDKENKELDEITKTLPNNETVCKEILANLGNTSNVIIKNEEDTNDCLYMIFNNTILLGKFKADFIRIQTIAHECIHSIQNKKTLWFNFIISNILNIYFLVMIILTLFNKIEYTSTCILILLMLGIIKYVLRNYLENDAMIRARYLSEKYLEEIDNITVDEKEKLLKEYDYINSIGIPFYNFSIISGAIIKVIIYSIVVII